MFRRLPIATGRILERLWTVMVLGFALGSSGCAFLRMVYFNVPTLSAPENFESRWVAPSKHPHALPRADDAASLDVDRLLPPPQRSLDELLLATGTRAFLVLRDDQVVYERYFHGATASTVLPSFSMSKTYAALLVGCAIDDGLITSVDQPLISFVPELADKSGYGDVKIDHLLRMTSGIDFDEETPAGPLFYYATDLRSRMYVFDVTSAPGVKYAYGSVNLQILWDVIHRRLGGRTVSAYFEEKIWGPLGAAQWASWSLDSVESGVEKLSSGFNATAQDHARIGLLYLHEGRAWGRTVVSSRWIAQSLVPDSVSGAQHTSDGLVLRGQYQWFLTLDRRAFFSKGYNGQYIFVVPGKNMVFVRFGEGYGDIDWPALFLKLSGQ